jgi:Zn-dependent protease
MMVATPRYFATVATESNLVWLVVVAAVVVALVLPLLLVLPVATLDGRVGGSWGQVDESWGQVQTHDVQRELQDDKSLIVLVF